MKKIPESIYEKIQVGFVFDLKKNRIFFIVASLFLPARAQTINLFLLFTSKRGRK
jgi:hypothetical protein